MRPSLALLAVVLLLVSSGFAQAPATPPTAADLISAAIANAAANASNATAYTFHEEYNSIIIGNDTNSDPSIQGMAGTKAPVRSTVPIPAQESKGGVAQGNFQYDVLFVDGVPIRRLLSVNHQPLSPEAAAAEGRRYDASVAAVHSLSAETRRALTKGGGNSVSLDPKQLLTQYDCAITGHEKVDKRPATVLQCKLRPGVKPAEGEDPPISNDVRLWIDEEKPFFHRTRIRLDHTVGPYGAKSDIIFNWNLIDGVWHQTSTEINWDSPNGTFAGRGEVRDLFSNFKRFRTSSEILPADSGLTAAVPLPPQR